MSNTYVELLEVRELAECIGGISAPLSSGRYVGTSASTYPFSRPMTLVTTTSPFWIFSAPGREPAAGLYSR